MWLLSFIQSLDRFWTATSITHYQALSQVVIKKGSRHRHLARRARPYHLTLPPYSYTRYTLMARYVVRLVSGQRTDE
jgi:hypothetical protein